MPNGVLEAMASGICGLLSDIPQHKELFEISQYSFYFYLLLLKILLSLDCLSVRGKLEKYFLLFL